MKEYKIYLAGAMGCYKTKEEANAWRKYVEDQFKLVNKYCDNVKYECFNPCNYFDYWNPSHKTEKEIMRIELSVLSKCDCVLVNLKDLDKSLGTSDEILYAYLHNIPIFGFCESEEFVLHPWKEEQITRIESGKNALNEVLDYILDLF